MDEFEERNIILLKESEIESILDNWSKDYKQVEVTHIEKDDFRLVFKTKEGKYYETMYSEDVAKGLFYSQSFATQVFPKERKATIVVYE